MPAPDCDYIIAPRKRKAQSALSSTAPTQPNSNIALSTSTHSTKLFVLGSSTKKTAFNQKVGALLNMLRC